MSHPVNIKTKPFNNYSLEILLYYFRIQASEFNELNGIQPVCHAVNDCVDMVLVSIHLMENRDILTLAICVKTLAMPCFHVFGISFLFIILILMYTLFYSTSCKGL
jgi:hypothetical protein